MAGKTETLHFKVHPNILNIIRTAYWYENKERWAFNCLSCFKGLDLDTANALLRGDAHFITKDDGNTLTAVFANEVKFKKEILEHKKHLKENEEEEKRERERQRIASEKEEFEVYKPKPKRNKVVSDIQNRYDRITNEEARTKYSNNYLANEFFIKATMTKDKKERKLWMQTAQDYKNKVFEFVYKGHHYTFLDSARSQSHCPHCDNESKDTFWSKTDKAFIGEYNFSKTQSAYCFECPKCFKHFFYHRSKL